VHKCEEEVSREFLFHLGGGQSWGQERKRGLVKVKRGGMLVEGGVELHRKYGVKN